MAKQFDATIKKLVESHPADWLAFAKLPPAESLKILDTDLSTVSPAADKVLRVDAAEPYIAHLEFQSGADSDFDQRMLLYNVLLRSKHKLPVRGVVILLRPEAEASRISGGVREVNDADTYLDFRYRVIQLWEQPVESILAGGIGTLPLAPISKVAEGNLPLVISRMEQRLADELTPGEVNETWTATFILLGLRYPPQVGAMLLRGARHMKESTTYQAILAEGEAKGEAKGETLGRLHEARALLLRLGTRRLRTPPPAIEAEIATISELARLEAMIERTTDVSSWEDLLSLQP